jgi:DNA-binding CsgD family transcriptional regulator
VREAIVGRTDELSALTALLDGAAARPAALILEGDPGIGKTTLWRAGCALARERGFRVLDATPASAEVRLAYAGLADLLSGLDADASVGLPEPQREALDAALLRGAGAGRPPDRRAVAAALLTVVEGLARTSPVLVAVDDLQWLDPSSAAALAFAVRRLAGPVGVLAACHAASEAVTLHLSHGAEAPRLTVGPLAPGTVHRLVRDRLGRSLPRAVTARVDRMAGGNPLFALEIARTVAEAPAPLTVALPDTLRGLVGEGLRDLPPDVGEALAVAAALDGPPIAFVARVLPAVDVRAALAAAEERGIVRFAGGAVRFTHPLLAAGVADGLSPAQRRATHTRLAELVEDGEQRARHLALSAVDADPATVAALEDGARQALARGAPAAAAELLELARALGADPPDRRVRAAGHHFDAGDAERARSLLESALVELGPGADRAAARSLLGTIRHRDGSYAEAATILAEALDEAPAGSALAVTTALELSFVLTNLGQVAAAEPHVRGAADAAARLGDDGLLAQTLMVSATVALLLGHGLDEALLQRALALEDHDRRGFAFHRPSLLACLLFATVGRTDEAWAAIAGVRERCRERGEDSELIYTAIHAVSLQCSLGDLDRATALAAEADELAEELGTRTARAIACSTRALVAAWAGRTEEARRAAGDSLALFSHDGSVLGALMPLTTLGVLDLSLGEPEPVVERLAPLALGVVAAGAGDPAAVPFVADAAEALIAVGRGAEAEPIVGWLEARGQALDRAWALAVGARGRALLHAAAGDLDAAERCCERALAEHDRLPLPLERGRTLLVLGRVRRRRRQRVTARTALDEALSIFDRLGTPLWAAQAQAELARVQPRRTTPLTLTASERRIAELTAEGLTNREVAAALFVSHRTVEATLARVYRKLQIGSRAELGRRMADSG